MPNMVVGMFVSCTKTYNRLTVRIWTSYQRLPSGKGDIDTRYTLLERSYVLAASFFASTPTIDILN